MSPKTLTSEGSPLLSLKNRFKKNERKPMKLLQISLYVLISLSVFAQNLNYPNQTLDEIQTKIDSLNKLKIMLSAEIKNIELSIDSLNNLKSQLNTKVEYNSVDSDIFANIIEDSDAKLRGSPAPNGQVIKTIPRNTRIAVLDFDGKYWKVKYQDRISYFDGKWRVKYQDLIGYIAQAFIKSNDDLNLILTSYRANAIKRINVLKERKARIESRKVWIKTFRANIRENPNKNSKIFCNLNQGDVLFVQEKKGNWLKVFWHSTGNFDLYRFKTTNELVDSYNSGWIHISIISEEYIQKPSFNERRRKSFVFNHPDVTECYNQAILGGRIILGMTEEMVIASWGNPKEVNRTVYSFGVHKQYIYGNDIRYRKYLYFENGVLTSWQD